MTDYANQFATTQPSTFFIPENEPFDQPAQFGAIGAALANLGTQCIAVRRERDRLQAREWELESQVRSLTNENEQKRSILAANQKAITDAARLVHDYHRITAGLKELVVTLEERRNAGATTTSLSRALTAIEQFFQPPSKGPSQDA